MKKPLAEDAGFLKAILDNPDDDAVRLVYADWLEEQGNPDRAEFIRLQINFAKSWFTRFTGMSVQEVRPDPDSKRMDKLERKFNKQWTKEITHFGGVVWWMWRGMPGLLDVIEWQRLQKSAARLFADGPVEYLFFRRLTREAGRWLGKSPYLAQIRVLDFAWGNSWDPEGLEALLDSDNLVHLRVLDFHKASCGDWLAETLAKARHLTGLQLLDLSDYGVGDEGALALAQSKPLRKTGLLRVRGEFLSTEVKKELRKSFGKRVDLT
jgi:uncharacterized protein (TIGR02996 family)